ncbi:MAG: F0F1 ATP synthase subunit B [Erysipelotrichia bacterium]|nr:F0F1 ATP synthase subunit B [Erysipelotrichia bacterium]
MGDIGETIGTIAEKLVPNLLSFVIQLISFIILIVIIFFVAYKPVKRVLKERADHVETEIKDADEQRVVASADVKEAKAILADSKVQASAIIKQAELKGESRAEAILIAAKLEAKTMLAQAQNDIVQAKEEALENIRNEMVNVALAASKEILKREINVTDNQRLAEDFAKRLN